MKSEFENGELRFRNQQVDVADTVLCDSEGVPYKEFQKSNESRLLEQRVAMHHQQMRISEQKFIDKQQQTILLMQQGRYSTEDNSTTTEFESGTYDSPSETEDTAELYNGVIDEV